MKSPLTKAKDKLWSLCREISFLKYPDKKCYTCGAGPLEGSNCQLGHFITSSTCSTEMRYCLDNLRVQCFRCNISLSGNWPAFERHLREEMGEDFVEELKERNEISKGAKYGIFWINQCITEYEEIKSRMRANKRQSGEDIT